MLLLHFLSTHPIFPYTTPCLHLYRYISIFSCPRFTDPELSTTVLVATVLNHNTPFFFSSADLREEEIVSCACNSCPYDSYKYYKGLNQDKPESRVMLSNKSKLHVGLGCRLVADHLSSMGVALACIPSDAIKHTPHMQPSPSLLSPSLELCWRLNPEFHTC